MGLGRVEPHNEGESFCMTVLGLSFRAVPTPWRRCMAMRVHVGSPLAVGVEEEIPIGHITNGVHIPTCLAWQMQQLYDRILSPNGSTRMGEPEIWQEIYRCDPGELGETHYALKNLLVQFVRRRVSRQCRRRGESDEAVEQARNLLDPNILTIGFARRFATYKGADLIMADADRLAATGQRSAAPLQIIFAGKRTRADEPGKRLIRKIANLRHDPRFAGRVVYVEDYDINVARHLVQGVDVWLEQSAAPAGSFRHQRAKSGAQRCA